MPANGYGVGGQQRVSMWRYFSGFLQPAVEGYNKGDFAGALRLLNDRRPGSSVEYEQNLYLKALCHQGLGEFGNSKQEFKTVQAHAGDDELRDKAAEGLKELEHRKRKPGINQTIFKFNDVADQSPLAP